jgi:hypothetical protein
MLHRNRIFQNITPKMRIRTRCYKLAYLKVDYLNYILANEYSKQILRHDNCSQVR